MVYKKMSQYKVAKGPKAKESGLEVSYDRTTGNQTNGKNRKVRETSLLLPNIKKMKRRPFRVRPQI
ncbi:hypothetical protein [Neobacillus terrae]|uniref:hypothetical protein n=1 Tax=Neobacillus terrae TaxID=3034837 RepID=UPI00140B0D29|nr:hypothetical protein [Neobacillus terrae]NHM33463.1 hypothetical protein [Neobacillus terrae]